MTAIRAILFFAYVTTNLLPGAARADAGHDHAAPAASGSPGASVPRLEAQSDLFEIVGVVQNGAMTLFLDRYATNDPVVGAKIDVEAGSIKGAAQANPDGTYTFKHAVLTQPGQLPVTFAIAAGADNDLLAGELLIADSAAPKAAANDDPLRKRWWWVAGALFLFAGIVIALWLRRQRVRGIAQ